MADEISIPLREHLETLIHDHADQNEVRFRERDLRYDQRFRAIEDATREKAATLDKRFDTVNEFRFTLADQQKNFITRPEALALIVAVSSLIGCIVAAMDFILKR